MIDLEDYVGIDTKILCYFGGAVLGTAVIVTGLYWLIFGFNKWEGDMQIAADLMTAATMAPVAQTPTYTFAAGTAEQIVTFTSAHPMKSV